MFMKQNDPDGENEDFGRVDHQTFIAGRTGRPLDVLIDSAGAIVGLLFYSTYYIVYKSGYKRALQENEAYEVNK